MIRWFNDITDLMDVFEQTLCDSEGQEAWHAEIHVIAESNTTQ